MTVSAFMGRDGLSLGEEARLLINSLSRVRGKPEAAKKLRNDDQPQSLTDDKESESRLF